MPFHFCMDEVLMLLAMIPFIGMFFRKVHAWWHSKFNHQCHHIEQCQETHVEHKYSPYDRVPYQKVSYEDIEYLKGEPAPLKITVPITIEESHEDHQDCDKDC